MFNFYYISGQASFIDWTTIIASLISAILGAAIAGYFSTKATYTTYENNKKLKEAEMKRYEKATALSIIEELIVLLDLYENEFDKQYSLINEETYLDNTYFVSQDYTTVYTQNAGELGLITNEKLRNLIIKSYTILKRYIEYLLMYTENYNRFLKKRENFVQGIYPNLINISCAITDYKYEIEKIKSSLACNDWSWFNPQYATQEQVINFFRSEDLLIKDLINDSLYLKKLYYELKNCIKETVLLSTSIYN